MNFHTQKATHLDKRNINKLSQIQPLQLELLDMLSIEEMEFILGGALGNGYFNGRLLTANDLTKEQTYH